MFRDRTARGTVTVFFGMTIMLILSMFFSLIELVHLYALKRNAELAACTGVESAFADYNRPLYKQYGILAIDGAYGTGAMRLEHLENRAYDYMADNAGTPRGRVNYLSLGVGECNVSKYALLTDQNGKAFLKQAADYEKTQGLAEAAGHAGLSGSDGAGRGSAGPDRVDELKSAGERMKEDLETPEGDFAEGTSGIDEMLDAGKDALNGKDASSEQAESDPPEAGSSEKPASPAAPPPENPIETVAQWKKTGILGQVLTPEQPLSGEALNASDRVSVRALRAGTMSGSVGLSLSDRALYELYFAEHFGCYTGQKSGESEKRKGLCYQMEYLIGGKASDQENLSHAVKMLMAVREAENLLALSRDSGRVSEAESIAAALCTAVALPELSEAVKMGILAAWAYAESVLDVRRLLSGGKIAMIKDPSQWTSEIAALGACADTSVKAKDCENGLTYRQYLAGMLLVISERKLAYRGMDVIEDALRRQEDYRNIRMDQMIYAAEFDSEFDGAPVFLSMVIVPGGPGTYQFHLKNRMTYLL